MNPVNLFRALVRILNEHHDSDWQRRLAGTYAFVTVVVLPWASLALASAYIASESPFAARTLPLFVCGSVASVAVYAGYKLGFIRFAGLYIIFLYWLLGLGLVWSTGIGMGAMVLFAASVALSGTLCGYWCSFGLATLSAGLLFGFRAAELGGLVHPHYVMSEQPTSFSTVIFLTLSFHLLTAVSGSLFRLERTRQRIREMEQNFAHQKSVLAHKLKKQSQKLQSAESEKMQQIYRLAEVGEVSAALMHDLANNLTTLALEIDGIETSHSERSVRRARDQIRQINSILDRTRQQLKGDYRPKVFDVSKEIARAVAALETPARQAGVSLQWRKPRSAHFDCTGEPVLFGQLVTNLVTNAIESYGRRPVPAEDRRVEVVLNARGKTFDIMISDWGPGIGPAVAARIFDPFYTTKDEGMGIGLYLAKRFIEGTFRGRLELASSAQPTTFRISLPRRIQKSRSQPH